MNWKKIAIERLQEYESRKLSLDLIPEQIKTLELTYTAIKGATGDETGVRPTNGKKDDAWIANILKREELKKSLQIAQSECCITEKALETLSDEEKHILYIFYIAKQRGHVERLSEELCVERSRVYELKDEALQKFTLACCGVVGY